jgi:cytochrome c-type biogenesis protein
MIDLSLVGLVTAFLAGVVSFLSPCVLPLVPAYLSYIGGSSLSEGEATESKGRTILWQTLWFSLGFATVFVALGASASALGRLLMAHREIITWVGGGFVIAFGLFMTGLLRLPWLQMDVRLLHRVEQDTGPFFAYVLGLAFAFGWTPCIGPILGSILTLAASSQSQNGLVLLSLYSVGLAVPFILSGLFLERFMRHHRALKRWSRPLHIATGLMLVAMGIALITGHITRVASWLLTTFPIFTRLG